MGVGDEKDQGLQGFASKCAHAAKFSTFLVFSGRADSAAAWLPQVQESYVQIQVQAMPENPVQYLGGLSKPEPCNKK